MTPSTVAAPGYRPDIDGLRALAVLSVIAFHYGVPFVSGGYIGVDVFFVISGFLISRLLVREFADGTFSLIHFYERRVRRIFPALFVVLMASSIAAYLIAFPRDFGDYAKSLFAAVLFMSNFEFWREQSYFAAGHELKPLLHTWSLAVEEQFYLIFPLLLLFLHKRFRAHLLLVLTIITDLSLTFAMWSLSWDRSFAFYSPFTRVWELLIGALLALSSWSGGPRWSREFLGAGGLHCNSFSSSALFSDDSISRSSSLVTQPWCRCRDRCR